MNNISFFRKSCSLVILFLISIGCETSPRGTLISKEPKEKVLFEINDLAIGEIISGTFMNKNEFIILEGNGKIIKQYNTDGELITEINLEEHFLNNHHFKIVKSFKDCIVLWDEDRLHLYSIDLTNLETNLLLETNYGIMDFEIYSGLIALYPVGGQGLLKIVDLEKNKNLYEDSNEPETHKVLTSLKYNGRNLIVRDNTPNTSFTYTPIDNIIFNNIIIDENQDVLLEKKSSDNLLSNEEIKDSYNYYNNPAKLTEYLSESDVMISFFKKDDKFLLITESGKFEDIDKAALNNSKRFINYFFIDPNTHIVLSRYKTKHKFDDSFYLSNEKELFKIHRKENSDNYNVSLINFD
ncbi:MAG: hypothetical protein ACQESK_03510 [Bacteroidota bacterium]